MKRFRTFGLVCFLTAVHVTPIGAADFQVNTYTTSSQWGPSVAAAAGGEFVVVWQSRYQDGDGEGIFGQRLDRWGGKPAAEFRVNSYTASNQQFPRVACDDAGDFVVVWSSQDQDGDTWGIFAPRFASSGSPAGVEFQMNAYTIGNQGFGSVVACDRAARFVVAWTSYGQDGSYNGVFHSPPSTGCSPSPLEGCDAPQSSRIVVRDQVDGVRDKLLWRFIKGMSVTTPANFGDSLPDPLVESLVPPVTVQLRNNSNGLCWGDVCQGEDVVRNEPGDFKAKR